MKFLGLLLDFHFVAIFLHVLTVIVAIASMQHRAVIIIVATFFLVPKCWFLFFILFIGLNQLPLLVRRRLQPRRIVVCELCIDSFIFLLIITVICFLLRTFLVLHLIILLLITIRLFLSEEGFSH